MAKTLRKFLLITKAELLIRKRKVKMFAQEVAINSIVFAINEALEQIEKDEE